MARRSLLQQSWDETREFVGAHTRATAWGATALVLVLVAVVVAATRDDSSEPGTTLRADEQSASISTPSTFFGNDLVDNPNRPSGGRKTPGDRSPGVTLRNGPGFNLYTGTIPDYSGGKSGGTATTVTAGNGTTATSVAGEPDDGGTSATTTNTTTTLAPAVFGPNRIAYVSGDATYSVNPDGSDPRLVANRAFHPAWAPGHNALAVVEDDNPGGVLSYVTPTGARYALTPTPDGTGEGDSRPTWSPDGLRLAFGRIDYQAPGSYSSIWVINKDGRNAKRISVAGCVSADPSWSPDGTHIAFWSSRDHCSGGDIGSYELYVVRSDGTGLRRLGTAVNSGAPAFSPDGTKLAFSSDRDGNFEIYVMNVDGTEETRLTTSAGEDIDPTWSPDGSRIAFTRRNTIFTMRPDGTDPRAVVNGIQPSWS